MSPPAKFLLREDVGSARRSTSSRGAPGVRGGRGLGSVSRIFVRYQANRYAELPGESARKFDRHAAKLAVGSARNENGIRGYQASAKLALWGEPRSCVVLGVSLSIPYDAVKKSGENAQENSGGRDHLPALSLSC